MTTSQASIPPARGVAVRIITSTLKGADLQAAIDSHLTRDAGMDPRDAALATRLAYGYMRLKLRLDSIVDVHLDRPDRLPPMVRLILGLAVYEILHLDKVPVYATVDWAVEEAKSITPGLGRLANSVLRRVDEAKAVTLSPDFYAQDRPRPSLAMSRFYSCPEWIVELWTRAYGEAEAKRLLEASLDAPPLGLRVNAQAPDALTLFERLAAHQGCLMARFPTLAFEADNHPDVSPELMDGRLTRQSAASQRSLLDLLDAAPDASLTDAPMLDACAGRGGKTAILLEQGLGPVLATDVNRRRIRGLTRELDRLGLGARPWLAALGRAERDTPARPMACVLVDAPCSGLGVLSRRPDIKWKRSLRDVAQLVTLQRGMLANLASVVRPGGSLLYLTCTANPAENEEQVETFLAEHPDFRLAAQHPVSAASPLKEFFFAARLTRS